MATPWKHIWLLWFCGVVAAAEYGKIAPLVGVLQAQYHLSLTAAGWLSSAIEFGAASCGLLGSLFIDRFGLRRAIHVGLLCLTLGSLCEGLPWLAGLWIGRIAESAGYLFIVVATPSLMATLASDADRPHALSLWSTFVPVGLAIGAVGSAAVISALPLPATFLAWAAPAALVLVLTLRLPAIEHAGGGALPLRQQMPGRSIWLLSAAFGCYAMVLVGVMAMLPAFLQDKTHASVLTAGALTGVASFVTILGSAFVSWRLKRTAAASQGRTFALLELVGLGVPAVLLAGLYGLAKDATSGLVTTSLVVDIAMAVSGIVAALVFARLSELGAKSGKSSLAVVNGILTHFGASGALLGPPLVGAAVTFGGWPVAAAGVVLFSAAALLLARLSAQADALNLKL